MLPHCSDWQREGRELALSPDTLLAVAGEVDVRDSEEKEEDDKDAPEFPTCFKPQPLGASGVGTLSNEEFVILSSCLRRG